MDICYCVQGAFAGISKFHSETYFEQSVAQSLHTATPSIIAPLVEYYLASDEYEEAFTLLRRVLTALIHHVKSADQFSPVADVIIERLKQEPYTESRLEKILPVAVIVCSVRQGSRLSRTYSFYAC